LSNPGLVIATLQELRALRASGIGNWNFKRSKGPPFGLAGFDTASGEPDHSAKAGIGRQAPVPKLISKLPLPKHFPIVFGIEGVATGSALPITIFGPRFD
jgi:hypothetical protein